MAQEGEQKKRTVLVAEDEEPLREALTLRLNEEGYEVLEAADGEEAFKKLAEHVPDVALLDIKMPKRSGLTIYQEIKESEWGRSIKVMFLTNSSALDNVAFAQAYGPVDYLVKSDWDLEDIIGKVNEKFES